jgi:hypothetical protein
MSEGMEQKQRKHTASKNKCEMDLMIADTPALKLNSVEAVD